jgi:predicted Zn-dependent protease
MGLARYFLHHEQPEQAQPYVDEVLKLAPLNPTAHMLNGEILAATGNTVRAISEFETAQKTTPEDSQLLWDLMRAYNAAGRQADAAKIKAEIASLLAKKQAEK